MTFYLIDHSLKDFGGHHFDYATLILRAAEVSGFDVILATNRRFHADGRFPDSWRVLPLFRYHAYSRYSVHGGWQDGALGLDGRRLSLLSTRRFLDIGVVNRWWRLWNFEKACRELFTQAPLSGGDQVFIPTLSEFDLLGLVRFLKSCGDTTKADWHLQFHFSFLNGRDPEYDRQHEVQSQFQRQFQGALRQLEGHRLHFYTTTEELARQYNRLGVADFHPLTYPIRGVFHPPRSRRINTPLRVTSAGAVRPEKGQQHLSELVTRLWTDYFAAGKLQLAIQCKSTRFSRSPRRVVDSADVGRLNARFRLPDEDCHDPVIYIRHPIDSKDYVRLIRGSDVGLLMYDQHRYYGRHAGVLGEYLSAGVPVIVPAGCWLAEQLAGPIHSHLDSLLGRPDSYNLAMEEAEDAATVRPTPESSRGFTKTEPFTCRVRLPPQASDLLLGFSWLEPQAAGTYVQVTARQYDSRRREVSCATTIASRRQPASMLFHLHTHSELVELQWSTAYDDARALIAKPRAQPLLGPRRPGGHYPAGRVGLIAATPQEVPALLEDIYQHYEHYRQSSLAFSERWHRDHRPEKTLARLLLSSEKQRAAA
jgi:hypothetical protein